MMKLFKPQHISWLLFLVISGCQAVTPKSDISQWKTECVGHYNIGLPDGVEVALSNPKTFKNPNISNRWIFDNSDNAPYSTSIRVYGNASDQLYDKYNKIYDDLASDAKQNLFNNGNQEAFSAYNKLTLKTKGFGWGNSEFAEIFLRRDSFLFHFKTQNQNIDSWLDSIQDTLIKRDLYEIPLTINSICIPYGYIKQDKYEEAGVGITYRLKNHPEIEIMLREQAFQGKRDEEGQLTLFWDYFGTDDKLHDGRKHGFQDVKLAGYSGKAIYVNITRADDTPDFGYAAVVKASDKHPDNPNLLLYITRTAKRAIGEPINEEAFKQLVEGVVKSIQKR